MTTALGVKAAYIHEPQKKHERATQKITDLIASASQELLVLDFNPLIEEDAKIKQLRKGAGQRHSEEAELSPERRRYYKQIMEKVRESDVKAFRYRRIIQIPIGRRLSDLIHNDEVFLNIAMNLFSGEKNNQKSLV